MESIPGNVVEKTWQNLAKLPPEKMVRLVNKMAKRQPVILAYLMAAGDAAPMTDDEKQSLLYMGLVIWRIMSKGSRPLFRITERLLEKMEKRNDSMLKYLAGETDSSFADAVELIFQNYNQVEVFRYVIEALVDEEDAIEFGENSKAFVMMCLKTVIDCFDYTPKIGTRPSSGK